VQTLRTTQPAALVPVDGGCRRLGDLQDLIQGQLVDEVVKMPSRGCVTGG
jgi:hypothetical protein